MKKVLNKGKRGNKKESLVAYEGILNQGNTLSRIELIQILIFLGLQATEEELMQEVRKIPSAPLGVRRFPLLNLLYGDEVKLL
jgi:hypothetical protein